MISQPYTLNRALDCTRWVWIHCQRRALLDLRDHSVSALIGPNVAALPEHLPSRGYVHKAFYLQPSAWVMQMWAREGFSCDRLKQWPAGIDTEEWPLRSSSNPKMPILIYHKQRPRSKLAALTSYLEHEHLPYRILEYSNGHSASYTESEYRRQLESCSFLIWLGRVETQGIAQQEALSSGVPILVVDAPNYRDAYPPPPYPEQVLDYPATSAPYFDDRCGTIVRSLENVPFGIGYMYDEFNRFKPGDFVRERLNLVSQAKALVSLFSEIEGSDAALGEDGLKNRPYRPSVTALLADIAYQLRTNPGIMPRLLMNRFIKGMARQRQ